jgi:hypothetical protein
MQQTLDGPVAHGPLETQDVPSAARCGACAAAVADCLKRLDGRIGLLRGRLGLVAGLGCWQEGW